MLPKGKLAGLIAIFAAIGLITATGAFTTVTAERTATVTTAGDSSALLQLSPTSDYAQETDGTLEISIGQEFSNSAIPGQDAGGLNLNARTQINDVFRITNQGTQAVDIWIGKSGNETQVVEFRDGPGSSGDRLDVESTPYENLGTGDSINVSMIIDLRGENIGEDVVILDGITIHANATTN